MATDRTFGMSAETESSWEDFLSETHRDFVLEFLERERTREEAIIARFLSSVG
jgi:hypothetical protein